MAKEHFIFIDGRKVAVDEELYRALMRPVWAKKRRSSRYNIGFLSFDALIEDGYEPAPVDPLVEEIVEDRLLLETLRAALNELSEEEYAIINALFYQEKSEREVAKDTGVPQKTIAYRKEKALEKLRDFFEKS